jgi:tellurite resistance protein TehA-like permease
MVTRSGQQGLARPEGSLPWDRTLESWNPLVVLLLTVVGAAGAVALLLLGWTSDEESREFVTSEGFVVWASVIAVQAAFWIVVAVPLWREVVHAYARAKPAPTIWVIPAVFVLLLVGLAFGSPAKAVDWPLVGHHVKVWILTGAAVLGVGIPAIFGICIVQDRVRRHLPGALDTSDIRLAVNARAQIRRFLGLAGATIGLAVLASGALQRATVPRFVGADEFSSTSVLLYGAFFTAILTVVYLPAHLSLRRLCADLRETWYPISAMPRPDDDAFSGWLDGRKRIDTVTQFETTALQQLQAAIFVLTPLLSGIVGSLIPRLA